MSRPTEFNDVASLTPLVHQRRIGWNDTDAAHIVYTVRFFEFAMAALDAWFREIYGGDWYELNVKRGTGTPWVHVEMDIKASLRPPEVLRTTVLVEKVGRSAITFQVTGRKEDGTVSYTGRYVCAICRMEPMRAMSIPDAERERVQQYIRQCEELGLTAEAPAP
jgi:4-hydroxybenzoyl-CoA thioesterase